MWLRRGSERVTERARNRGANTQCALCSKLPESSYQLDMTIPSLLSSATCHNPSTCPRASLAVVVHGHIPAKTFLVPIVVSHLSSVGELSPSYISVERPLIALTPSVASVTVIVAANLAPRCRSAR